MQMQIIQGKRNNEKNYFYIIIIISCIKEWNNDFLNSFQNNTIFLLNTLIMQSY